MSERFRNALIVGMALAMTAFLAISVATYDPVEDRVQALGSRIRCPVCQGESIADSPAAMARDMMALIAERVADGADDAAILEEVLSAYSGAVLLDPPASGQTLLLWLLPGLAVVAGVGVIAWWRSHPSKTVETTDVPAPGKRRALASSLALAGALAVIVAVAANFVQDRQGPASGVADLEVTDLAGVSNATLEAVVAANADHPQIDGMRLALADRYFEASDYRSAFPHYLAVAESEQATPFQVSTALVRLGWMAFDGNGEVETALRLFDEALEVTPGSPVAVYLKGRVLWCGAGNTTAAAGLFEQVLTAPDLDPELRGLVEPDLALVRSGFSCP